MSYPFETLHDSIWPVDSGMAFVIYPFSPDGHEKCNAVVRPAVIDAGLKFEDAQGVKGAAPLIGEIIKGIASSQIVIAILTEEKPNVYWELGIAMTWKPRTQLLTIGKEESGGLSPLPFDLSGFRHVPLNFGDPNASRKKLHTEIAATLKSHNELLARSVITARNLLGPIELMFLYRWGNATTGHLILPAYHAISESNEFLQPVSPDVGIFAKETLAVGPKLLATYMDAIALGSITKMGIAACSTAVKEVDGGQKREYSFYWTALGNHVLQLVGVISEEERIQRLPEIPSYIRDWRGGYVFMPPIPKY